MFLPDTPVWAGWARLPPLAPRGGPRSAARGNFKLSDVEGAYSIQRGYDPPARHRTRPDEAVMKPSAEIVGVAVASTVARPGARAPGGSSRACPGACADGGERLHAEIRSRGSAGGWGSRHWRRHRRSYDRPRDRADILIRMRGSKSSLPCGLSAPARAYTTVNTYIN